MNVSNPQRVSKAKAWKEFLSQLKSLDHLNNASLSVSDLYYQEV